MGCAPYPTVFFVFVLGASEPLFMVSRLDNDAPW
jgi:hypothetical protein